MEEMTIRVYRKIQHLLSAERLAGVVQPIATV